MCLIHTVTSCFPSCVQWWNWTNQRNRFQWLNQSLCCDVDFYFYFWAFRLFVPSFCLLLLAPGWASCATTPTWPGVKIACLASHSSWKPSWTSSRAASSMTWRNTAIKCTMAYVSLLVAVCFDLILNVFVIIKKMYTWECFYSLFSWDVCLSKASEKMLKAWQENEERAAAFAQVNEYFKNIFFNFSIMYISAQILMVAVVVWFLVLSCRWQRWAIWMMRSWLCTRR